jgi:hypothetical protein
VSNGYYRSPEGTFAPSHFLARTRKFLVQTTVDIDVACTLLIKYAGATGVYVVHAEQAQLQLHPGTNRQPMNLDASHSPSTQAGKSAKSRHSVPATGRGSSEVTIGGRSDKDELQKSSFDVMRARTRQTATSSLTRRRIWRRRRR